MLIGGYGTGKSHLAIAAMQQYGLRQARFWKVPDARLPDPERARGV
jgi:hypothetical protein